MDLEKERKISNEILMYLSDKNDVDEMCERLKGLIKEEILNK